MILKFSGKPTELLSKKKHSKVPSGAGVSNGGWGMGMTVTKQQLKK